MSLTPKGHIVRTGSVRLYDSKLDVWEEGLHPAMTWKESEAWERTFKRDVFARIVQQLRRLGWSVGFCPRIEKNYPALRLSFRYCTKGDLQAELHVSGRHIELEFWQDVQNVENKSGGKYDFDKLDRMTYLQRLEVTRTRTRIRDYLCNVFAGYTFDAPKIKSPNPDPLAYFNDSWDGEYEKKRGIHRFKRGADGWPDESHVHGYARIDGDGNRMNHGDIRCTHDRYTGRLRIGPVYGGINEQWLMVYGPGPRDFTHVFRKALFAYRPGETPAKQFPDDERRKRQQAALDKAVKAMQFERAAKLRDVLHPTVEPVRSAAPEAA